MMKKTWALVAAAVVLVGSAGALAVARYGRGMGPGGMGFMHERMLAQVEVRLKLTPEQSKQLRELMSSRRDQMRETFQAGQADRRALIQEVFKDNPSQAEIQKRVAAIQERQAAMINQMVDAGLQFNKSLSPEQRAEMNKMLAEHFEVADRMRQHMQERMHDRRGKGPGGPAGPPPAPDQQPEQ